MNDDRQTNTLKNVRIKHTMMETGISDHHANIFSFLKTTFTKMPPNKLQCRNYKQFEAHSFLQDVGQLPPKIICTEWEKILQKR